MKLNYRKFVAVALAGACLATTGSYVALAEDAVVDPTDPAVVEESLSGVLVTPPPVGVQVVVPEVPVIIEEPAYASPEEEDLTAGVNVNDPGPVMPADPGAVDSAVVGTVGPAPDAVALSTVGVRAADSAGGGECSASPRVPWKEDVKMWGSGSVTCSTTQRSLNVVVCLEYRQAGVWEELACKPKTVSQAKTTSKKVSAPCVPGRFRYRTLVSGVATSKSGQRTSIPQQTAATSGLVACMR